MGNNEDNRHMTPIIELIEQRKKSLVYWNGLILICDADYSEEIEYAKGQRDQVIKTIKDLERLLPKEKAIHIYFAEKYALSNRKAENRNEPSSAHLFFDETFKPYNK